MGGDRDRGLAIGPLVGGFLTEALSWCWFFFVNVPVAVLAIFLTVVAVRESRDETVSRRIDFVGLVTITAGLTALVLALQQSDTLGWGSPMVIGSLVASAVLLGVFFAEPRVREPLIELGLFANRSYLGANGVAFAQNFGFGALLFLLTLYLQNVLGYSPLKTGLVFLAFSAVLAVVDSFAGRLPVALCAVAFLLLTLVSPTSGLGIVIAALLVAGAGQALAYTVSTTGGMSAVPEEKAGIASGILSMIRLLGAVFGVAVTGALFKTMEYGKLAELLAASGANFGSSDRAEIRGLLSGSAAEQKLSQLARRPQRGSNASCARPSSMLSTVPCSCAWSSQSPASSPLSSSPGRHPSRSRAPPPSPRPRRPAKPEAAQLAKGRSPFVDCGSSPAFATRGPF